MTCVRMLFPNHTKKLTTVVIWLKDYQSIFHPKIVDTNISVRFLYIFPKLLYINMWLLSNPVILNKLVVSVLSTGPKVHRFKPGQGQRIFKGNKNPQHTFLQRGSKLLAPCHKILQHVVTVWKIYFLRQNTSFPSPVPPAGRNARKLWWMNQEFPCHSTMVLHAYISPGGREIDPMVAAVERRRLTPST
jgi:hypothetical protein